MQFQISNSKKLNGYFCYMQLKNTNAQRHETFVYEKFELHSNSRIQQHYQSHLILFQDIPRYFKLLRNGLVT